MKFTDCKNVARLAHQQLLDGLMKQDEFKSQPYAEYAATIVFYTVITCHALGINGWLPGGVRIIPTAKNDSLAGFALEVADSGEYQVDTDKLYRMASEGNDLGLLQMMLSSVSGRLNTLMPKLFGRYDKLSLSKLPADILGDSGFIFLMGEVAPCEDWALTPWSTLAWLASAYESEIDGELTDSAVENATNCRLPSARPILDSWCYKTMILDMVADVGKAPGSLRLLDPSCGYGELLTVAFDVVADQLVNAGYSLRDAVRLALSDILVGYESSPIAAAVCEVSLCLSAFSKDRRFLSRGISPNVIEFSSVEFSASEKGFLVFLSRRSGLLENLEHLSEIAALYRPSTEDLAALSQDEEMLLAYGEDTFPDLIGKLRSAKHRLEILSSPYDAVFCIPRGVKTSALSDSLDALSREYLPDARQLFPLCLLSNTLGYYPAGTAYSFVLPSSFLLASYYGDLRGSLIDKSQVKSIFEVKALAGGADLLIVSGTVGAPLEERPTLFMDLTNCDSQSVAGNLSIAENLASTQAFKHSQKSFRNIPTSPLSYWSSAAARQKYPAQLTLQGYANPRIGMLTRNSGMFIRNWWEVSDSKVNYLANSEDDFKAAGRAWAPYQFSHSLRKWYGDNDCIVLWENGGRAIRSFNKEGHAFLEEPLRFRPFAVWSGEMCVRIIPEGYLFDSSVSAVCDDPEKLYYVSAFCNSCVARSLVAVVSRTYSRLDVSMIPVIEPSDPQREMIDNLVVECVATAEQDWNKSEQSFDFKKHPLL